MQLVLASSSPYRRELLTRLSVPFSWQPPEIDERVRPGESPSELANRLSQEKAYALVSVFPRHLIIGSDQVAVHHTEVHFRKLNSSEIDRYLTHEQPYDCVGSFKAEGLGIALFSKITSDDPTAIIGLPMIKLCQMLGEHGYEVIDNIV